MIHYTPITPKDTNQLFSLAIDIWNSNYKNMISQHQIDYMLQLMYNPNQVTEELKKGYQWEFIIHQKAIVGYLSYYITDCQTKVFLSKIYLKKEAQGLGFGKKSIDRVVLYARSNNCQCVSLTVNRGNIKGVRAYKNYGFNLIEEKDFDIGAGFVMNDYIFEFPVS